MDPPRLCKHVTATIYLVYNFLSESVWRALLWNTPLPFKSSDPDPVVKDFIQWRRSSFVDIIAMATEPQIDGPKDQRP